MRPLDRIGSLKLKLGALIVAAVVVTLVVNEIGLSLNYKPFTRGLIAALFGLAMVQLLARGMTSPLREMARATKAMARGDYSLRVHATSRDEVGELARAFNAMATELAELDRLRRDLVANVSHELRTPISALQAVLENLVDGVSQPDADTVRAMLEQTERLGRLVTQLLDLSRLESGAVPIEVARFVLKPVLERAAAESTYAHPSHPSGPRTVTVDVDPVTLDVVADHERVHQVVTNLVDNALRHSPAAVSVSVHAAERDGVVVIEVRDQGPGIPEADRARVFDRFHRLDTSRSAAAGGSGLGLAIARWIVELHGGAIRAEPNSPTGCRMVVELPRGVA